jgi:predicted acyl esterase
MSLRIRPWGVAFFAAVIAALFAPSAMAADVPEGATWTEATIPSTDGVELHADILRPTSAAESGAKTPVILSIGPYFNHSGQTGPAGPVEGTSYDPVGPSTGPSDRFLDFVEGAHLMERGYTFVMVDLRGFGGSTGCLDWGGPGEQSDVVNAVEWAASQDWSTGKVGMYGKSYDGVTGLIGVDRQPEGLAAVVSQEPVYDLYRSLYGDGMRRENSVATPALYDAIDATPGPLLDDPAYNISGANDTQRPGCKPANWADQAGNDDHFSPYWRKRNLIPGAKGSEVPLFLTQGLTENNTVADGTAQYLNKHTGYERAWLGPWDHVRGNETEADGRLKMGRAGFFDEVMRFYDRFLQGARPSVKDPKIAVQTNDGKWRGEDVWPPADSTGYTTELLPGTYSDDGTGSVTGSDGVWTISPVLPYDAHLSGSGKAIVDVSSALPRANLVVDVYDLSQDDDGNWTGPLITRQGHMIYGNGAVPLKLWSADWKILAGHRIGVRVTDSNSDWWINVPTLQDVTVYDGSASEEGSEITLPFLSRFRDKTIQGDPGTQLEGYLSETTTVPAETVDASESDSFALPPKMAGWKPAPPAPPAGPAQSPATGTVTTGAPGAGQRSDATSSYFEFDVDGAYDNAKMQGVATPTAPADLDLYLQRQAADGTWAPAGDGNNGGDLDGETIGAGRLDPGHYRLEVHNYAGVPGNQVNVTLTFLNSDGDAGT